MWSFIRTWGLTLGDVCCHSWRCCTLKITHSCFINRVEKTFNKDLYLAISDCSDRVDGDDDGGSGDEDDDDDEGRQRLSVKCVTVVS